MALTADKLVNDERFRGDNPIQFLLYLPFGLLLMVIRIVLAVILWIASFILPDKSAARQLISTLACLTFGVHIKVKGSRDPKCSVLVANYVSCLDSLAASHALGCITLRKWKVPPFFASTLGIKSTSQFVRKQHFAENPDKPVLLQPEGGPTNGKGLLKFTDWSFPLPNRVQPIAITVERALTHPCVSRAARWRDALWHLASARSVYTLRALPPLERHDDCERDFAERLRRAIADALQVEATDLTWDDIRCARPAAPRPMPPGGNSERARLARQVKEVLPNVPLHDIMKDLAKTRSVDVTITNFLEGITPYTPEPPPGTEPQPSTSQAPPKYVTPAPTGVFPKTAKERQMSFQERKAQMIAEARQRYIEKHGLHVALNC
ncbi:lipid droplet-regulating VLDL assembly factor AUP1-like [Zerene cesonia]|uniref:lipid droplet-regulating VLDL assembly factor AUP1-like n=1 Tax=Zerene cesonia TaxID=33412 RepID=UPI0018E51677|nr:lipid droplet-regulating VLDL assembly factor AUP1-like [Zerene cesonia]